LRAIISDVHGNEEALVAVLEDIHKRGIKDIVSLGDLIGYGPEPGKCIDLASNFEVSLLGNHEDAILFQATGFSKRARLAAEWTRRELERTSKTMQTDPFDFIGGLPKKHTEDDLLLVHGSPRDPTQEYVFPTDVKRPNKLKSIFSKVKKVCFVGHTHYAGVLTEKREFLTPPELCNIYVIDKIKSIINVGSVGQPRDGNPKAGYVTFDGDTVVFHRVKYDVQKTVDKILKTRNLDNSLGTRLLNGK
jgi:diadenosine tetraphosphatase ApaH/serine/threonine PP2A family protein phosphatase